MEKINIKNWRTTKDILVSFCNYLNDDNVLINDINGNKLNEMDLNPGILIFLLIILVNAKREIIILDLGLEEKVKKN